MSNFSPAPPLPGDIGEAVSALPHRAYKILQDVARRQVRKTDFFWDFFESV